MDTYLPLFKGWNKKPRVTSLELLSVDEFSGEKAMPKVYENGPNQLQKVSSLHISIYHS